MANSKPRFLIAPSLVWNEVEKPVGARPVPAPATGWYTCYLIVELDIHRIFKQPDIRTAADIGLSRFCSQVRFGFGNFQYGPVPGCWAPLELT